MSLTFAVTAWSIVFFSWVHTIAHINNVAQFSAVNKQGFIGFLKAGFITGPTWTGWIMLIALMAMVFTSIEKPRRANYERFWYTHHLFIIFFFFWSFHGAFCMIKTDTPPFCSGIGVFWLYWMYGGFIYLLERIMREVRGRHKTFISKVIQHPSNVVEIQIKKEKTKTRAGQVSEWKSSFCLCVCLVQIPKYWPLCCSISSFAVQKCPFGNTIHSRLPALRKRITYLFISVVLETLRKLLQKLLAATSNPARARKMMGRLLLESINKRAMTTSTRQFAEFCHGYISMALLGAPPRMSSNMRLQSSWVLVLAWHRLHPSSRVSGIAWTTHRREPDFERCISSGSAVTSVHSSGSAPFFLLLKRRT